MNVWWETGSRLKIQDKEKNLLSLRVYSSFSRAGNLLISFLSELLFFSEKMSE